jgi:hypothetical protein
MGSPRLDNADGDGLFTIFIRPPSVKQRKNKWLLGRNAKHPAAPSL